MHLVLRPRQRLLERGREGRGGRGAWGVEGGRRQREVHHGVGEDEELVTS